MKKNGILLITVPSINLKPNKKHYRHYSERLLKEQISCLGPNATVVDVQHIVKMDRLYNVYRRATTNRFWNININIIDRCMWKHMWNNLRVTNAKFGTHIVAVIRKS